jgi:hypothetical protein
LLHASDRSRMNAIIPKAGSSPSCVDLGRITLTHVKRKRFAFYLSAMRGTVPDTSSGAALI